jgi:IS5 family transposase
VSVEWQRKLEQGRARFREITAAMASTWQALEKVKELLEETEREPARHGYRAAFLGKSLRPERTANAKPGTDKTANLPAGTEAPRASMS